MRPTEENSGLRAVKPLDQLQASSDDSSMCYRSGLAPTLTRITKLQGQCAPFSHFPPPTNHLNTLLHQTAGQGNDE